MDTLSVSADVLKAPALPSTAKAAVTGDETAKRTKIAAVARDFESQFLSVMLGQMFQGTEISAPFGGGEGEQAFHSFLTDAYAKGISRHGGIGVAGSIQREMLKLQGLN